MNHDQFLTAWTEALESAGLRPFFGPTETLDLGRMGRTHQAIVSPGLSRERQPFSVSAALTWTWDPLLSARAATTEEDMLAELLGEDGRHSDTQRPSLRVDVTLRASLPFDSPLPQPPASAWRRWAAQLQARLDRLLPVEVGEGDREGWVLAARSGPEVRLRCTLGGQLLLGAVELSAWQLVDLPRQWDDPDRAPDRPPDAQLASFARRVRQALDEWDRSLSLLLPQPPAPGTP